MRPAIKANHYTLRTQIATRGPVLPVNAVFAWFSRRLEVCEQPGCGLLHGHFVHTRIAGSI